MKKPVDKLSFVHGPDVNDQESKSLSFYNGPVVLVLKSQPPDRYSAYSVIPHEVELCLERVGVFEHTSCFTPSTSYE